MSDLGSASSGRDLLPGDPATLTSLGRQLTTLATGLGDAAATLDRIDSGSWQGRAGDAFRAAIKQQPKKYAVAADAFFSAGNAIQTYAEDLADAQRQASSAIAEWQSAQSASRAWQDARAKAPPSTPPRSDPGDAGRGSASSSLGHAQAQLDVSASRLRSVLDDARHAAPSKPGFFHRMFHDAENVAKAGFNLEKDAFNFAAGLELEELKTAWHFTEGLGDFAGATVVGAWDLGKFGYALTTDPVGTVEHTSRTLYAIGDYAVHHPVKFAETVGAAAANWEEFQKDPARWAGQVIPMVALAVMTGGAEGYVAGLRGGAAVYEGTVAAEEMLSEADRVEAAASAIKTVQAVSDNGMVLETMRESDDRKAVHAETERVVGKRIEHESSKATEEVVTEELRPRPVEVVEIRLVRLAIP